MARDWWLKLNRAEKHMVELKQEAKRYADSNPYSFTRVRLPDSDKKITGRFQIIEQPNPMIAVILGDFVHNLRSALDYVVVACVPKKRRYDASFPIVFEDIFAENESGNFVVNDSKRRKAFNSAIEGIHPDARAFIIDIQPYQFAAGTGRWNVDNISLGIISRMENADKHRQLITLGCGGKDCSIWFTLRDFEPPIPYNRPLDEGRQFLKDDTVIPFNFPPEMFSGIPHPVDNVAIVPSDMEMHLKTTAKILVQVSGVAGNQPSLHILEELLDGLLFETGLILERMEKFVL